MQNPWDSWTQSEWSRNNNYIIITVIGQGKLLKEMNASYEFTQKYAEKRSKGLVL